MPEYHESEKLPARTMGAGFCSNCGQLAVLCEIPPVLDLGLTNEEGIHERAQRLLDVFGRDWKSRLEVLWNDPLYGTYQVRYPQRAEAELKYPPSTHKFTVNETYTGAGCAMCGRPKDEHQTSG